MAGSEVGVAYVTLAVSGKGMVSGIQNEMAAISGVAAKSGAAAGASLGSSLLSAFKKAMPIVAVAAAVKGLYEVGQVFEDVRNTIIVGTGASGKALEGLEKSAKKVGGNTASSFKDVGTTIADLNTRLGLTGKPLETLSTKFLDLSRITKTDVASNIKDITRVFGDWGIKTGEQSGALDKIFTASQATGVGIGQLSQNVVQFGAPLRQMGFSFEESVAMFGKFEKEGVNISTVLSGLKMGLKNMAKAGEDPPKALARVVASIKGAGSTAEANTIAFKLFGARAGPDMAAAIREGRFELSDLVGALDNSAGSIADASERTRTLGTVFTVFKNKALLLLEPVATRVISGITEGMIWLQDKGGPAIAKLSSALNDALRPAFEAIGRVVIPILKDVGGAVVAFFGTLFGSEDFAGGTRFEAIGAAAFTLKETILPILRDIAGGISVFFRALGGEEDAGGLGKFARIGQIAFQLRETILPVLRDIGGAVKAFFGTLFGSGNAAEGTRFEAVGDAAVTFKRIIVQDVIPAVKQAWSGLQSVWSVALPVVVGLFNGIVDAVRILGPILLDIATVGFNAITGVIGFFVEHGTLAKTLLVAFVAGLAAFGIAAGVAAIPSALLTVGIYALSAAQAVVTTVTGIATGVMGAFGAVLAFVTSPIGIIVLAIAALAAAAYLVWKNWDPIKAFFVDLWDKVKGAFSAAWDAIQKVLSAAWDAIKAALERSGRPSRRSSSATWSSTSSSSRTPGTPSRRWLGRSGALSRRPSPRSGPP